jgi:deazaflavin-dependent oxidoreductase (nitroreductase family)
MSYNDGIIEEFRANEGRVGGPFEGASMVLVHHRGRRTGQERVNPLVYLPDEVDPDTIYVFATKSGAREHPDWYWNLTSAGEAHVERGTDEYDVTVDEVKGEERDRLYAQQVARRPSFADYEQKTAGIRTIPVLRLRRT